MLYTISTNELKNIESNDIIIIPLGIIDSSVFGVTILLVLDTPNENVLYCKQLDINNGEILGDVLQLSPSWIISIWRQV